MIANTYQHSTESRTLSLHLRTKRWSRLFLIGLFFSVLQIATSSVAYCQDEVQPSNSLLLEGDVVASVEFSLQAIDSMPSQKLPRFKLSTHSGELRRVIEGARGVLLKDVLATLELKAEKPRDFNRYYYILEATDGYKVVYSWNELYNTPVGDHVYLITRIGKSPATDLPERILCASLNDTVSGRRFVKCLKRIVLKKVE